MENDMENIIYIKEVDSTNNEIKKYNYMLDKYKFVALYSDIQTNGKGRFGNKWQSSEGNIQLSILIKNELLSPNITTIMSAISVCQVLEKIQGLHPKIKWINDILIEDKKVGGILVETSFFNNKVNEVTIGIGINVNSENLNLSAATSIKKVTGEKIDRNQLILDIIEKVIYNFIIKMDYVNEYNSRLIHYNKNIYINEKKVLSRGINKQGNLTIEENGQIKNINTNEISIKL